MNGKSDDIGNQKIIYICEDSLEGIFSGIYDAYMLGHSPELAELELSGQEQYRLFCTTVVTKPDLFKAEKVARTLKKRMSEREYFAFCLILTSYGERKAQAMFAVVKWVLKGHMRKSIFDNLADDDIRLAMEYSRNANNELMHLRGFVRFAECRGNVLYAILSPKNNILPYLANHFEDRFPMENFIICDEGRNFYAVHPAGEECFYAGGEVPSFQGAIPMESQAEVRAEVHSQDTRAGGKYGVSETEQYYRDLFCHFCTSLGIKERENWELQRNMLPLRFRPYMTEFQDGKDV